MGWSSRWATSLRWAAMAVEQRLTTTTMPRTPETDAVMDADDAVRDYDRAPETNMAVAYRVLADVVAGQRPVRVEQVIDVACGPGHFTLALPGLLNVDAVTGIDLSLPMIARAREHATRRQSPACFVQGDATALTAFAADSVDVTVFGYAAHHMPDASALAAALAEQDRVTRPDGLIAIMDLGRLASPALTERYVRHQGASPLALGATRLRDDFRASLFAAWTGAELTAALPPGRRRWWYAATPGLPVLQWVVGLAPDRPGPNPATLPPTPSLPFPPDDDDDLVLLRRALHLARFVAVVPRGNP